MELVKIRYSNNQFSWTVVDELGEVISLLRDWIIHLEEINLSPNTIEAYSRQLSRLATYLKGIDKSLEMITTADYDDFLQWLPVYLAIPETPSKLLVLKQPSRQLLSSSQKNQIHLAVKSFYRYLSGKQEFSFDHSQLSNRHNGVNSYKPFLDHINSRRTVRQKDRYLNGDIGRVQKKITEKRLKPEQVLELIQACHLLRDAFLVTLLYNTGMRMGETLGLRHTDIDIEEGIIWTVPRNDNENNARCKGSKCRAIPVMPYIISMYEDFMMSDEYVDAFESGTKYVFCNVKKGRIGKALSRSYAQNLCDALVNRTGISFHWHMFRHTHASEAIADGYSLLQLAERLGHASPQTTVDFYKHLFSKEIRKLHLSGPENVQQRLEEFNQTKILNEGASKWI